MGTGDPGRGRGHLLGQLLTPESFDLEATPPTVAVKATISKRRRVDVQPLPTELAASLRPWLADKPARVAVFRLTKRTAEMLRVDLKAAGIPCEDQPGRVVDFHALRHTYVSAVVSSNPSLKDQQTLARHSTPVLTIGRYAHTNPAEIARALQGLPTCPTTPDARVPEPDSMTGPSREGAANWRRLGTT